MCLNRVLNVKAVVAAFNQEKALVGAFSVIVQLHRLIDLRHYLGYCVVLRHPAGHHRVLAQAVYLGQRLDFLIKQQINLSF